MDQPNNKQNKMVTFSKRSSRTKAKKKNSKQRKTKKRSVKRQNGPKSKTRQRSQTTSKSQTVTPTKEKDKENSEERKLKTKQQARVEDFREKEPSSEGKKNGGGGGQGEKTNESVSKSKGSQVVPSSQLVEQPPKKIEVKNMDPDEKKMKHLIKKLKKEKAAPRPPSVPLDEKSRLLMDRVVKKPYPQRYKIKSKEELLMDEKSSFFKVSVPSNRGSVTNSQGKKPMEKEEDPYADCPKLADVLKMPPCKSVFNDKDVPFWAEYCEPTESDMAGMDHAEAVNSEHIEMLQEKKFQLKTVAEKVTLDSFQPLVHLKDRDEKHFNEALVFSNTIRTVINIQNLTSEATSGQLRKREAKLKTKNLKVTIPENVVPECYVYARSDPFTITRAPKATNTTNTGISGE